MVSSEITLAVAVTEAYSNHERLDELTGRLIRDLRELGVESIGRPSGDAVPEGAKGDPITLGTLALTIVPVLLPGLVEFLQAWVVRGENRTVKIRTAAGLEVEFTPGKRFSETELVALVEKLTQAQV